MHMNVSTYRGQRLSDPSDGSNSGSQEEHYELLTTGHLSGPCLPIS